VQPVPKTQPFGLGFPKSNLFLHSTFPKIQPGSFPKPNLKHTLDCSERAHGASQLEALSLESASREAYFRRVETFTISFGMLQFQLQLWGKSQRDH
uniref:Uncharacterized protein n=1 Tax=Geospiza parvula TaxID=87175 RepID=A0A8U8CK91_GEOPR